MRFYAAYEQEQLTPADGAEHARVSAILDQLSRAFGTTVPTFYLNEEMPRGVLAYYQTEDNTLHFGDTRPFVVSHEMGHHIHTYFNIPCSRENCERFARMIEEWYVKSSTGYAAVKPSIGSYQRYDYSFCGNCSVYYLSTYTPAIIATGALIGGGLALSYLVKNSRKTRW